jgi:plasmid stability protein
MSNLTISLDDQIIKAARIRAIQQGTSLSAKVREFLASYVQDTQAPNPQLVAGQAFIAAARNSNANSDAVAWSREDAYDRVYPVLANNTNKPT